ncbi:DUF5131 family protein [Candidatus Dependentiae bacterium]|nr:MAG: DUF5131 family protein [Candidatus Dependentiae bacterium]
MGEQTKIEWCDHTFNGVRGCAKKRIPIVEGNPEAFYPSGCDHCYAESMSKRFPKNLGIWGVNGVRVLAKQHIWDEPHHWNRRAKERGVRGRVFAYSLGDMGEMPVKELHADAKLYGYEPTNEQVENAERNQHVCDEARRKLFALVEATPFLDWLLLTKRIEEIVGQVPKHWLSDPPSNWWQGTSVSTQPDVDFRLAKLIEVPAAVRFISAEPLLEKIDIRRFLDNEYAPRDFGGAMAEAIGWRVDWVICGGESSLSAREFDIPAMESLVDQCAEYGVALFNKQLGFRPIEEIDSTRVRLKLVDKKGGDMDEWPERLSHLRIRQFPEVRL